MSSGNRGRIMPSPGRLAVAISTAVAAAHNPSAQADEALPEIIVTARKRTENLQDVPVSIQVIGDEEIKRAGLTALDDTIRMLPSVSSVSTAPGASKIIFRGVADTNRTFFSDTSAAFYIDEQSLSQPTQTPEPRLVDIERIEALAGPQGTLYGASAQSGTLRIITNKPDPSKFEVIGDLTVADGRDSEPSYDASAVLNLPLIQDKLAIRLVGFAAEDGSFIDNVLGGYVDDEIVVSPGDVPVNNAAFVEKDESGGATYSGGRASLRWLVNDNWTITPGVIFQDMESAGNFDHEPDFAGDLNKVRFVSEERDDTWTQVGLTIEGDLGFAQLVSATSYFTRDVYYNLDNTAYVNYLRGDGSNLKYEFGPEPVGLGWVQNQDTSRISQEFRLSHGGETWSWLAGLFFEHFEDHWDFRSRVQDYENTPAFGYWTGGAPYFSYDIEPGATQDGFYESNNKQKTEQYAVFGEATYALDDHWSFTGGGRWFSNKRDRTYFIAQPVSRIDTLENPVERTSDFTIKASVQYKFNDEKLMYFRYEEGYRNGGGNVNREGQTFLTGDYDPDFLHLYELGFKSRWLDNRLQANVTFFHQAWEDFQTEVSDTNPNTFATVVVNAGDATIDGVELQFTATPIDGLELDVNITNLFTQELNEDLDLLGADPLDPLPTDDPNFPSLPLVPQVFYADGARLAIAPEFKIAASAQYTFDGDIMGGEPFVWLGWSYQDEALADLECNTDLCDPNEEMDGYSLVDLRLGLSGETWELDVFADNLTDERAQVYKYRSYTTQPFATFTTNRPREYGVRFMKKWGSGG